MAERPTLGVLAVEVTRGSSNNLFQVATLVRAATAVEATVQVFFRGAAVRKLARDRVNVDEWSAIYAPVLGSLQERLHAADFRDMDSFLRDAKEHGDQVQFWASEETLKSEGLTLDHLVSSIDGVLPEKDFAHMVKESSVSLIF